MKRNEKKSWQEIICCIAVNLFFFFFFQSCNSAFPSEYDFDNGTCPVIDNWDTAWDACEEETQTEIETLRQEIADRDAVITSLTDEVSARDSIIAGWMDKEKHTRDLLYSCESDLEIEKEQQ